MKSHTIIMLVSVWAVRLVNWFLRKKDSEKSFSTPFSNSLNASLPRWSISSRDFRFFGRELRKPPLVIAICNYSIPVD